MLAHMLTSICEKYWQLVLAQGLLAGFGTGLLFVPSVVILPRYFTKNRGFAMGVGAAGSSVGM